MARIKGIVARICAAIGTPSRRPGNDIDDQNRSYTAFPDPKCATNAAAYYQASDNYSSRNCFTFARPALRM
jgi:hypothetical protein